VYVYRYTSRDYFEQVHLTSEPFKAFKDTLGSFEWVEPMALKLYEEQDIGF
jgi:hypothetical protein